MPAMPWIKMYTEMLNDPKLHGLDDALKWRFVQCCLLAGEADSDGYLTDSEQGSVDYLAWRMGVPADGLLADLDALAARGLLSCDDDGSYFVTRFMSRQGRSQSEKRAAWRERKQRQRDVSRGSHAGVTAPDKDKDKDKETDTDQEQHTDTEADAVAVVLRDAGMSQPDVVAQEAATSGLVLDDIRGIIAHAQQQRLGCGWIRTMIRTGTRAPPERDGDDRARYGRGAGVRT